MVKMIFVCATDELARPLKSLDRQLVGELEGQSDVVIVAAGEKEQVDEALGHLDPVDVVMTSGWSALNECARQLKVPQCHLFGEDDDLDGVVGQDREELLGWPSVMLVRSIAHARLLRSRGRFPKLLLLSGETASDQIGCLAATDLVSGIVDNSVREPDAETLATALESAGGHLLSSRSELMDACLGRSGAVRIQTVNLQHLYLARVNVTFRRALASAGGITADGWPVVQLLQSMGYSVERATGADLVGLMLSDPRAEGLRIAIIGGASAPADEFATRAREAGASVVFREHGDKRDWDPVILTDHLREARAELTLVAVTQPVGDLLAMELVEAGYPGTVIGIGAAVELYVGGERRAAPWIQKLRLEWLFRLAQDPKRLWRRYLVEGLPTYFTVVWPRVWRSRRRALR